MFQSLEPSVLKIESKQFKPIAETPRVNGYAQNAETSF